MSEMTPEGAAIEAPAVEAAPAEPAFTVDPQEWQQTQQAIQELAQIVQPQPPPWQQQQPQGPPIPDPFADDYQQQMLAWGEALVAPYQQAEQQRQWSAAQDDAMSTLNTLAESGGDFDRGMAWARANELVQWQGIPVEQALEQAAKDTREYEKRVGEAYYQQQIAQLQQAGGRGPMPVGANGTQTFPTGGLGNIHNAVTAKLFGPQVGG